MIAQAEGALARSTPAQFTVGQLEAAQRRSVALAREWRRGPAVQALEDAFARLDPDDAEAVAHRAAQVLADGRVEALLLPMIAALRRDPWLEPPLRVSRDRLRIGGILFDCPAVSIVATILSADVLAALPPPVTVVVAGRLSVVRYVRGGGARLRRWRAEPVAADFVAAAAGPCVPLGTLPIADGVVIRQDGRTEAVMIEDARADVVMLSATIRGGAAPVMREYDIASGVLVRSATTDDGAARAQMLLAYLRLAGRAGAGACFEAAARDPAFFLRWAAMREWLALDARAALPRLREMADDPHVEVAAAARQTRTMVEARLACLY